MKKMRIWFAMLNVVSQALVAISDEKLTLDEMIRIAEAAFGAFDMSADVGLLDMSFDPDGNLILKIPKEFLDQLTIDIDLD